MELDFGGSMKSHGVTRGRHSPPFLMIGLVVVIVILSVNYWHSSTRLADLQQQDEELRERFHELLVAKNQLSAKNEILETKVKENVETYDSLRLIRDKKEEELLLCKETFESSKRDAEIAKSEDEKRVVAAENKLRRAERNITQHLQIHDQDGSVVASLREENEKLSAQLSALQESLNQAKSSAPLHSTPFPNTSKEDCNQHCLVLVEAAQERLFKKVVAKFGQDALNVLESSDFGIPRRPGKLMTGPPPIGKVADDILVVGRDGKIISGAISPSSTESNKNNPVDSERELPNQAIPPGRSSTPGALLIDQNQVDTQLDLDKVNRNSVGDANDGAANVGAAPPNLDKNEDSKLGNLAAAVADAVGAAAVGLKPPQELPKKPATGVNDIVDVEAEATDDEDDDDDDAVIDKAAAAEAEVPRAQQEPILDMKDQDERKDGIDQLNQNLATFDGDRPPAV